MAQLQCIHCPKSFKTESGLEWHLVHLHVGAASPVAQMESQPLAGEGGTPPPMEVVELEEGDDDWTEAILASLNEVTQIQRQLGTDMGQLRARLERLESAEAATGGLKKDADDLKASITSLDRTVSEIQSICEAMAWIIWGLDC